MINRDVSINSWLNDEEWPSLPHTDQNAWDDGDSLITHPDMHSSDVSDADSLNIQSCVTLKFVNTIIHGPTVVPVHPPPP